MEHGSENSRDIRERDEIYDVLIGALLQQWPFSYLTMVRNHISSHSTRLFSINPESNSITVSGDVLDALAHSMTNRVYFHVRSGGLSLVFNSILIVSPDSSSLLEKPKFCKFEFPDTLRLSQKRKALRINLADHHEIPVTLFVDLNTRHHGKVVDISETGAKIMFEGNLTQQLTGSEIISDCQMLLPDAACIESRIRVLGVVYNPEQNLSYLRCEYIKTDLSSEAQIKKMIADELSKMSKAELAMAI